MLPAALDPSLVARAADGLWDILDEHMPRLKRHDNSTWTTFAGDEQILRRMDQGKSHAGGDVLFDMACVAELLPTLPNTCLLTHMSPGPR